ncbi:MaoC family dehydratase N-terminal domain-containing protein [Qipengyuania sp. MTN3-11]|uniref:FAS1-like dehydratase domain-containing protein n=1 Tax=Qipengyuania sp. MTN3-11 TaxID=3056557 RepID=UPI0036F277DE
MAAVTPAQVEEWQGAIGRSREEREVLCDTALRRYASAVGVPGAPPLPHWAFFLPCPADDAIGPDGHPRRGDFLPDVTLPRRMFAAASMEFYDPLDTGSEAVLTSRITDVSHKAGRSGDLVFVEVEREIAQEGRMRVRERQTFVYREEGSSVSLPEPAAEPPEGELWQPGEVNLFRFSAATFNGHRIHYDLPYARDVEGYPALVVHGPFTAARLAALAMREGALTGFSFRALAPLFLGQPIILRRTADNRFAAIRCDGTVAMEARTEPG